MSDTYMRHTFSLARDVSSTREYPRFVAPIELDQHHRCVLASTVTYSRCLRWCRVCHDVIRGDVADEEEEKVEKNKKGKDASLQPQEVTIFRVSSLYRVDHREMISGTVCVNNRRLLANHPIFRSEATRERREGKKSK